VLAVDYHFTNLSEVDQTAFGEMVEGYRREMQAHCYRMMGSLHDAEDMVQETFLRAWRRRDTYEGRASFRAWLYKIATNACLDVLKQRPRRAIPITYQAVGSASEPIPPSIMEPIWLEPYPDDYLAVEDHQPERVYSARESITLAFMAALHLLPPRQRAVLLLRDVMGWHAGEVAALLELTESAVKSALHRARSTLAAQNLTPDAAPSESIHPQLEHYVRAWETADVDALLRLLKEDAIFSMPPTPAWYQGHGDIEWVLAQGIFAGQADSRWRLLPTRANSQPAYGLYRVSDAGDQYNAYGLQVITLAGDQIADIITFRVPDMLPRFGLPMSLAAAAKS